MNEHRFYDISTKTCVSTPNYVDAHVHFFPEIAQLSGTFALNSIQISDWLQIKNIANLNSRQIIPFFGIHPWHTCNLPQYWEDFLSDILENTQFAGVGEIGLDATSAHKDSILTQESIFVQQLKIAVDFQRPIAIHGVRAWNILEKHLRQNLRENRSLPVLFHAFSGSPELIQQILNRWKINAYYSINPARFSFSAQHKHLMRLLHNIPCNRLLLESDAENLETAQALPTFYPLVATALHLTVEELLAQQTRNFTEFLAL